MKALPFAILAVWALLIPVTPTGLTVVGPRPDTTKTIFVFSWSAVTGASSYHLRVVSNNAANPIWPTDYATARLYHQLPGTRTFDTLTIPNPAESSSVKLALRSCDSTGCSAFATKQFYLRRYYPPLTPSPTGGTTVRAALLALYGCAIPPTGTKTCGPWSAVNDSGIVVGWFKVTVGPP